MAIMTHQIAGAPARPARDALNAYYASDRYARLCDMYPAGHRFKAEPEEMRLRDAAAAESMAALSALRS